MLFKVGRAARSLTPATIYAEAAGLGVLRTVVKGRVGTRARGASVGMRCALPACCPRSANGLPPGSFELRCSFRNPPQTLPPEAASSPGSPAPGTVSLITAEGAVTRRWALEPGLGAWVARPPGPVAHTSHTCCSWQWVEDCGSGPSAPAPHEADTHLFSPRSSPNQSAALWLLVGGCHAQKTQLHPVLGTMLSRRSRAAAPGCSWVALGDSLGRALSQKTWYQDLLLVK